MFSFAIERYLSAFINRVQFKLVSEFLQYRQNLKGKGQFEPDLADYRTNNPFENFISAQLDLPDRTT